MNRELRFTRSAEAAFRELGGTRTAPVS